MKLDHMIQVYKRYCLVQGSNPIAGSQSVKEMLTEIFHLNCYNFYSLLLSKKKKTFTELRDF